VCLLSLKGKKKFLEGPSKIVNIEDGLNFDSIKVKSLRREKRPHFHSITKIIAPYNKVLRDDGGLYTSILKI
jgi:hypothetical protein